MANPVGRHAWKTLMAMLRCMRMRMLVHECEWSSQDSACGRSIVNSVRSSGSVSGHKRLLVTIMVDS